MDLAIRLLKVEGLYTSDRYHRQRAEKLQQFIEDNGTERVDIVVTSYRNHTGPGIRKYKNWERIGMTFEPKRMIWAVTRR